MPFTLGFYDLFSYLIPGMLYLYVIYEATRLSNVCFSALFPGLDLSFLPDYGVLAVFLAIALLVGHIFDYLAHWLVFDVIFRKTSQTVLNEIKKRDASVNIQFEAKDWHLLLIVVQHRNLALAQNFDKYEADSIMFRNISLIALLMAILMLSRSIMETNPQFLIAMAGAIVVFIISLQRSREFHKWFFEGVFTGALMYGKSLNEVLEYGETQNLEHSVRLNWSRNKGGKE